MKSPYTVLVMLEANSPEIGKQLDQAINANSSRFIGDAGFISREVYRCQEASRYVNVLRWETESDQVRSMEKVTDCPIHKLVAEGKVQLRVGPVSQVY